MAEPTLNSDAAKGASGPETYGQMLTQAREGKGLTVEQVASQLRLAPKQITGLEASDPAVFGSTVYNRAHVRSYARLLGIEEQKIMNAFNNSLSKEERDLQLFIRRTTHNLRPYKEETTKNGKMKGLGFLLFLIVLGTVGYLGWDYVADKVDIDELKAKVTSMVPMLGSSEEKAAKAEPVANTTGIQAGTDAATPADPNAAPATAAGGAAPTDPNAAPAANAAGAQPPDQTGLATVGRTPEARALEDKVVAEQNQQAAQPNATGTTQTAETQQPQNADPLQLTQGPQGGFEAIVNSPSGEANLHFAASEGDCWFGIYEGGKLVNNVTLKDGQTKDFTHKMPFRVTVGNHFRAKVDLDGRPVDLSRGSRSGSISFLVRAQ